MSNFIEAFGKGRKVIIPSIQRDYVQPLDNSIIKGFVEVLIDTFSSFNRTKDLNYLYGITEPNGDFIPIDGQQRLTTLWLLHLYVAKRVNEIISVHIEYQTRDISGDFCKALSENFVNINIDADNLSKEIKDSPWFIGSWYDSTTVKSILLALNCIHSVALERKPDFNKMWEQMNKGIDCPVSFAFHNPKDLGKDIYVKMNSRGKSLSRFENLKAWLDDKLKDFQSAHCQHKFATKFYMDWRVDMDNSWTDFFWQNRNFNTLFPEEIDDAQLRLFYTIAYIVWAEKKPAQRNIMGTDAEAILSRMRHSSVDIATYELNKYNIFNEEFFIFAKKSLVGLQRIHKALNSNIQAIDEKDISGKVVFWDIEETKEPLTFIYQLLLSEKNPEIAYPKIVLAASTLYFASNNIQEKDLLNWIRFTRNIVNNNSDNMREEYIHSVLSAFRKWAKQLKRKGWHKFITELQKVPYIDGAQIDEERNKYLWIKEHPECAESIFKLENHKFFFGRISYLLSYAENKTSAFFNSSSEILGELFDNDAPKEIIREKFRFQRTLLALSDTYGYGRYVGSNWLFPDTKSEWKKYLEDNTFPHNIGINRLMDILNQRVLDTPIVVCLQNIIKEKKTTIQDWRYELIVHPALWNYMQKKMLRWNDSSSVFLLKKERMGNRNRRAELRSYGLYIDLRLMFEKNAILNGWELNFYDWYCSDRKNSCLFFQKEIDGNLIAIDIFFDTIYAKSNNTDDAFVIEIFDRKAQKEHSKELNQISLSFLENMIDCSSFSWNENNNFESSVLAKENVFTLVKQIISNT